jgi:hypothetical protein
MKLLLKQMLTLYHNETTVATASQINLNGNLRCRCITTNFQCKQCCHSIIIKQMSWYHNEICTESLVGIAIKQIQS